jgi:seryl-tRNA synthetase
MITEIREEFNHNLSQQIYMSDESWKHIKNTVEDIIALINTSAQKLGEDARSVELAKVIFNEMEKREVDPVEMALSEVKSEIRALF